MSFDDNVRKQADEYQKLTKLNYFQVLGVSQEADENEIRRAWRKKLLECHPDKNRDKIAQATAATKHVNAAYEVLKDSHMRSAYKTHINAKQAVNSEQESNISLMNMEIYIDLSNLSSATESLLSLAGMAIHTYVEFNKLAFMVHLDGLLEKFLNAADADGSDYAAKQMFEFVECLDPKDENFHIIEDKIKLARTVIAEHIGFSTENKTDRKLAKINFDNNLESFNDLLKRGVLENKNSTREDRVELLKLMHLTLVVDRSLKSVQESIYGRIANHSSVENRIKVKALLHLVGLCLNKFNPTDKDLSAAKDNLNKVDACFSDASLKEKFSKIASNLSAKLTDEIYKALSVHAEKGEQSKFRELAKIDKNAVKAELLIHAARSGKAMFEVVEKQGDFDLSKLVDLHKSPDYGYNPAHSAAAYGHTDLLEYFNEKCKAWLSQKSRTSENTPLMLAIVNDKDSAANYLIEQNFGVDEPDNEKRTPLAMAYWHSNVNIFQKLLTAGANCNVKVGNNPNASRLGKLFYGAAPHNSLLHQAIADNNEIFVNLLLDGKKTDVNAKNDNDITPLIQAYKANSLTLFASLLKKGANPNVVYDKSTGNTLLHEATYQMKADFVKLLLSEETTKLDTVNKDGKTAKQLADDNKAHYTPGRFSMFYSKSNIDLSTNIVNLFENRNTAPVVERQPSATTPGK